MATRFHATSSGSGAVVRTVPNLPGALVRRLSERLAVSPTVAMRVALLYGDIEWQAGGASELSYSASDYARRMGFHRHTVHADFSHLLTLGAVSVSYDQKHHPIVRLNSLVAVALPATADDDSSASTLSIVSPSPGDSIDAPLSIPSTSPCRSHRHPPVDALANPLSKPSTALEKTSKTQEKEDRKNKRGKPAHSSALQRQGEEQPTSLQKPEAGSSRAGRKAAEPEPSAPPEPSEAGAEPETAEPTTGPGGSGLLDRLLAAFRASAPPEWPAPERLTVSRERRVRLRQALEHAGSAEAVKRH